MTDTSLPTISVSLDELGIIKNYGDGSAWYGSKIIKGNYLYSTDLCYNEDTDKFELVISKYDLSVKLLTSIVIIDLAQKCPFICGDNIRQGLIDVKWLTPIINDELKLVVTFAYNKRQESGPVCNMLCVTNVIKLKESDLSVIDILVRQIDIAPDIGRFINMTFGKAKLKPENWFATIRLAPSDLKIYSYHDQFRAVFNVRAPNGRTFVGGFNEGVGNPVWFAISCCNYFNARLYANLTCNNRYFGWGEKCYKGNHTGRLYTVNFDENFSTIELKYIDIEGNTSFIPSRWTACRHYPLSHRRGFVCTESCLLNGSVPVIVFSDKDTSVYKVPAKYIFDTDSHINILWNFYHDPSNDFIYFVCYEFSGPHAVLGYISFDHDNKTANVYYTNLIKANVDYHSNLGYKAVVHEYMSTEYIYLKNYFIQDSRYIELFPLQWLRDNIIGSKTIKAEIYEFDKKEVYGVQGIV
jgi:hypothetical protein